MTEFVKIVDTPINALEGVDSIAQKHGTNSLNRLWELSKKHSIGTISAFNSVADSGGVASTLAQNDKRSHQLKSKLLMQGYGVTLIKGIYIEHYGADNQHEAISDLYLVVDFNDSDNFKEHLIVLAKQFRQDHITYSQSTGDYYLISCYASRNSDDGKGEIVTEVKLSEPMFSDSGELHPKIDGRPFVFEFVSASVDVLSNHYPTEIRSIKALAEEEVY